jgi:hypothetical protein
LFVLDVDEQTQTGMASQFAKAVFHGDMTQHNGEQQTAPEDADGVRVATVVSPLGEQGEGTFVGDRGEQSADGLQGGGIDQFVPGEQGSAKSWRHGKTSVKLGAQRLREKTRNLSPPHGGVGVKIEKKRPFGENGEGNAVMSGGEQKPIM